MKFKLIVVLLVSLVNLHPAHAAEKKPAFTWHEYNQQALELSKRTLAGSFKKIGRRGAWDDEAIKFLDQSAVYFTYRQTSNLYRDVQPASHADLIAVGEAVIGAGCKDPLVAHCLAVVYSNDGNPDKAVPLFRSALPRLVEMKYPDIVVWSAATHLATLDRKSDDGKKAGKLAGERMIRMAGGKLSDIERREVLIHLRNFSNTLSRDNQAEVVEQLRQQPKSDRWIVDVLDGELELRRAWDQRGGGWAVEVSDEAMAKFVEHSRKASERLTRAWGLAPNLPEAPTIMIQVATGVPEAGGNFMTWFDRAIAAQIDYVDAYDKVLWGLLPDWHGDYAAMYEIGLRAAQTQRFDTDVPWQLVRALRAISTSSGKLWGELKRPGVYEQLDDVLIGYANFTKAGNADWYKSARIALAWRAGKYADAKELLDKLDQAKLDLDAFKTFDANDPAVAVSRIHALTGPSAAVARQGEKAVEKRDWAAALEAFVKFHERWDAAHADPLNSAPKPLDDPEHAYADQRIRFTGNRVKLAVGEPVLVQPTKAFEDWTHRAGEWHIADDGAVHGQMVKYESPYMVYNGDLGQGFEVTGSAGHTKGGGARAAIVLTTDERMTWIVFYERAVLVHFDGGHKSFPRERSPEAKFSVRFKDGELTVRVNDQLVIDRFARTEVRGARLGIGTVDDFNGVSIFRDLTVRQLTN